MRSRLLTVVPSAVIGALILVVVSGCVGPVGDPDLWWHLRLGTQLVDQHSLSTPSTWSTFGTVSWVPTEPLPEMVGAEFDRWFGLGGVAWLHALALCLVVLSVYLTNRRLASAGAAAVTTFLTLVAMGLSLTPRPQLLSFALLPVVLMAWFATERDLRPRWWLVPLTWLWSLVHGYWFLGVAFGCLMAAATLWQSRPGRRTSLALIAVPLLSAGVVCLNPVGLGVFRAPFAVNAAAKWVTEWRRTDLLGVDALVCELMVLVIVVLWARRRDFRISRVLLLLTAGFWLWYASRTVAISGLVLSPLLAEALGGRLEDLPERRRGRLREAAWLGGWAVACLAVMAVALSRTSVQPYGVPVSLDAALSRYPAGTAVINSYGIGGWIRWRHPALDPVIDGLATPYSGRWFERVHRAMHGEQGWQQFVRETGAPIALLQDGTPLIHDLRTIGWRTLGRGEGYWLLSAPPDGQTRAPSSSGSRGVIVATR